MGAAPAAGPTIGDNPGADVVLAVPSGTVAGDLLLALIISDNDGSDAALTTPSGWTSISHSAASVSTAAGFGAIFTRSATGSEPSTYTFGAATTSDNVGLMYRISGHDPSTPFAASPVWSRPAPTGSGITALVAPSVTLSGTGLLVCFWDLEATFGGTITPPGGMTGSSYLNGTTFLNVGYGYETGASGASGTRTATASTSGGSNTLGYLTVSLAIKDAPAGLVPQSRPARRPRPVRREGAAASTAMAQQPTIPPRRRSVRAGIPPRRGRAAFIPPAQVPAPPPRAPVAPSPRRRILATRRAKAVAPIAPQPIPAPAVPPRRRPVPLRARRVPSVPAQQQVPISPTWVPGAPLARRIGRLTARRRPTQLVPDSSVPAVRPRRRTAPVRRPGRIAQVAPPQILLAPPWSPPALARRTLKGLTRRRTAPPTLVLTQAAPVPIYPPQTARRTRPALVVRRARGDTAPPVDQAALAATSPRRSLRPARRRPLVAVAPIGQHMAPPSSPGQKRRPMRARRALAAVPPAAQALPPPVQRSTRAATARPLQRRRPIRIVPPPQVSPPKSPGQIVMRRRLPAVRRGHSSFPIQLGAPPRPGTAVAGLRAATGAAPGTRASSGATPGARGTTTAMGGH